MTVLIIEDLSGASGSPTPVSAEETHIQVRLATWQALEAENLLTSALPAR